MEQLTQKRLKELFNYEPAIGFFTRKSNGSVAKNIHNGYVRIFIDYKEYRAHRLAHLYMTGEFPAGIIDHINHVKTDNRWGNLRVVTHQENCKNMSLYETNCSGTPGVYFHKRDKQWIACVYVNGKKKHLGCFLNKDAAIHAREQANDLYGYHSNHGKVA